ncbi:MAG: MogA/MoaB family molybdenum cofactor biosynthesis protein [Promethearchaeota archaeon]|jgi:molybdenum cofactor biosynthesis protein B
MEKNIEVHEEHKKKAPKKVVFALVVVSTSRYEELNLKKTTSDKTIPIVKKIFDKEPSISLDLAEIVSDSEESINDILIRIMKEDAIDVIIFSGGTGLSPKDITYETIEPRLEKKFSGFGEIFRSLSYNEIGSAAMLSRAIAGILRSKKKNKAVFLLPGSPKAVKLALEALIMPEIGHILYIINKEE